MKSHPGHRGLDVVLSVDIEQARLHSLGELRAGIRVNERLLESFSVVLLYQLPDWPKAVALFRVNGDHGEHANEGGEIISGPHTHLAPPQRQGLPPGPAFKARFAEALDGRYRALTFAWDLFCRRANVVDGEKMAKVVARLYTDLAQGELDDLLTLPDS